MERALNAELSDRLGYAKHDPAGYKTWNSRNGKTSKTLKGDFGEMELETPRDRNATFEPLIVAKESGPLDRIRRQQAPIRRETMLELKNRGVKDVIIARGDGLKGFPEAMLAKQASTVDRKPLRRYSSSPCKVVRCAFGAPVLTYVSWKYKS